MFKPVNRLLHTKKCFIVNTFAIILTIIIVLIIIPDAGPDVKTPMVVINVLTRLNKKQTAGESMGKSENMEV